MDDIHEKWCACAECLVRKMKGREKEMLIKSNNNDIVIISKGE